MKTVSVHVLSVLAFIFVSFSAQTLSHFVINNEHFTSIGYLRSEPIIPMGIAAMIIQGAIMSLALSAWSSKSTEIVKGVVVATLFGLFLTAYISLVEPAKYMVPDILAWIRVETSVSIIQFLAFGLLLGFVHSRFQCNS